MLKYALYLFLLLFVGTYKSAAQDTSYVKVPHIYARAELVQTTEENEKFDDEITVTSFVAIGGPPVENQDVLQSATKEQHNAWLTFVLEDINANSFRDSRKEKDWFTDEMFIGCQPYELDSAGWLLSESTGQRIALFRAVCLHKTTNHGSEWYVSTLR